MNPVTFAKARGYELGAYFPEPWFRFTDRSERVGTCPWSLIFPPRSVVGKSRDRLTLNLNSWPFTSLASLLERHATLSERARRDVRAASKGSALLAIQAVENERPVREREMMRLADKVEEVLPGIRAVLQVVVAETERVLISEGKGQLVVEREECQEEARFQHNMKAGMVPEDLLRRDREDQIKRAAEYDGAALLYRDMRNLWLLVCHGALWGIDAVSEEEILNRFERKYFTPPAIVKAQVAGLRHYFGELFALQHELRTVHDIGEALEEVARAALRGELSNDVHVSEEPPPVSTTTETDPLLIEEGGKWKWKGTASELAAVVYVAPCDYPPEQEYSKRAQYFGAYIDFDNWKAVVEVCKRLKQGRTPSLPEPRVERLCRMLTDIIGR